MTARSLRAHTRFLLARWRPVDNIDWTGLTPLSVQVYRLLLALDYCIPLCRKCGPCRFNYHALLTISLPSMTSNQAHASNPLPLARTRGAVITPNRSCWLGGPRSTCNPSLFATPRSSTSANMPASPKPFPMGTTTPWTTPAPARPPRRKRGPAHLRLDGHRQEHLRHAQESVNPSSPPARRPSHRRTTLARIRRS